jgi:hypothetical protein
MGVSSVAGGSSAVCWSFGGGAEYAADGFQAHRLVRATWMLGSGDEA